jgi:hypothetical protein
LPVRPLNVELHERSGQLLGLPRRRRLAGAEPHDGVFHADGLARLQREIADDSVALVEQAENRDALGHRSDAGFIHLRRRRTDGDRIAFFGNLLVLLAAAGSQDRRRQQESGASRPQSGVHGV